MENVYPALNRRKPAEFAVMDHYKHQRNRGTIDSDPVLKISYKNPTFGDVMVLYVDIDSTNQMRDVKYEGYGCSISMASCSMITELIKEQTLAEVQHSKRLFFDMIQLGILPDDDEIGDTAALAGVHSLRAHHNCALMGWQALEKALERHKQMDAGLADSFR